MANQNSTEKVWFITGASRGFGRIWTEAALERGDKVAATARKKDSIAHLEQKYGDRVLIQELDVTNAAQVKQTIAHAHAHFGRLDIVLNNAGYSLVGTIEECEADKIRDLFETNIMGPVAVIQAALPFLRQQGYGHILGTSSTLGHITMPVIGYYCSSKWAFEAIYESLAMEVAQFGIKVSIIEPGAYATEFGSQESLEFGDNMEAYTSFKNSFIERLKDSKRGDPNATPEALFKLVDAEQPPLRLFLGNQNLPAVRKAYGERLATLEAWEPVSAAAQG